MGKGRLKKWFKEKGAKKILGGLEKFGTLIPGVGGIVSTGAAQLKERLGDKEAQKAMAATYAGAVAESVDNAQGIVSRQGSFEEQVEMEAKKQRIKRILGQVGMVLAGLTVVLIPIILIVRSRKRKGFARKKRRR